MTIETKGSTERIEESELRSGTRKSKVANVGKTFCQLAVEKMGYPGADVARYPGVTSSSVNRLAVSEKPADLKKYLKML